MTARAVALYALLLVACGGGSASSSGGATTAGGGSGGSAAQGQSVADAMILFCAAPSRVDQRDECDDSTMRATCLQEEVGRGVTNADVLALVQDLQTSMSTDEKIAKVHALATQAGIAHCATETTLSSP